MATISPVRIGNMALSHIGDDSTIESLTEASAQAKQINLWYDYSRLQVLEAFDWSFARKRVALAVLEVITDDSTDNQRFDWVYRYQYPSDCVAARKISNPSGKTDDAVPFEVETTPDGSARSVLTDMEDAILIYTFDAEVAVLFTAHFVDTLAALIAHRIAFSLTGQRSTANDMLQLYNAMLSIAPAHNANEQVAPPAREAEWVRGR